MNKHIIDPSTLTEEQTTLIKHQYNMAEKDRLLEDDCAGCVGYGRATLLEWLFGEELFEKGE